MDFEISVKSALALISHLDRDVSLSEGDDEDESWKAGGFTDLTKHAHQTRLYGSELATVEATTSSVDEGEEGKVLLAQKNLLPIDPTTSNPF